MGEEAQQHITHISVHFDWVRFRVAIAQEVGILMVIIFFWWTRQLTLRKNAALCKVHQYCGYWYTWTYPRAMSSYATVLIYNDTSYTGTKFSMCHVEKNIGLWPPVRWFSFPFSVQLFCLGPVASWFVKTSLLLLLKPSSLLYKISFVLPSKT